MLEQRYDRSTIKKEPFSCSTQTRQALFLPEASDYIGGSPEESLSLCKPASKSPFLLGLREDARKHSLSISVGVHEPSDDPESKRIKNTLLWIDEEGEIAHRYQKLHLFDLDLSDQGGPVMKVRSTSSSQSTGPKWSLPTASTRLTPFFRKATPPSPALKSFHPSPAPSGRSAQPSASTCASPKFLSR